MGGGGIIMELWQPYCEDSYEAGRKNKCPEKGG